MVATAGVVLVDALPREFELATVYSAAVGTAAAQPDLANRLVAALAGPDAAAARASGGFEALPSTTPGPGAAHG